ncbi:MAG: LLM class F420-dependent oxidoreductase [Gammaproteobacteria bacterium]|nr:LLM class F420-dependent oxidoreductase [Gammaproteobacteria bacterium]
MKIGLIPVNIGVQNVEQMVAIARHAEASGYESVWTFEHAIVPMDYQSKYPYNPSGKMGVAPETNLVDPLIALAAVAASTKTIRLGTGVNILSQTNPLMAAKQAASLDFVSGGRFMYGVGIGWLQEEFVAMGTPFERRGARFDDYVVAMKKVWSGEVVEHDSRFINWHGFKSYPIPVQKPHLPIVIGGSKGKIYERIAKLGDGWYAPTGSPEELAPMLAELKRVCAQHGRDFTSIEITTMWPGQGGADAVKAFERLGVSRLVVPLMALGPDPMKGIADLAKQVIR